VAQTEDHAVASAPSVLTRGAVACAATPRRGVPRDRVQACLVCLTGLRPQSTRTGSKHTVRFSVVTPSFRSSGWLRLCIASVADQAAESEHIVQDGGSDDGTLEWLLQDKRVKVFVEKDQGMYDAINRGLRRASGDILAYLNCDEQYLPGALRTVGDFFEQHPQVDVLFGDIVMVDVRGQYLCHRKVQVPLKYHTWVCHLSTLSCAMFFRRRLVFDREWLFDPRLRDVADGVWVLGLLQKGVKMAALGQFTSAFSCTGANMSTGPNARREARELFESAPFWARQARPLIVLHHRLRRLLGGMYFQRPFAYAIYTRDSPAQRVVHEVTKPTVKREGLEFARASCRANPA
jgi:glycosyltransferase involved in cell wall biosynthesis